MVVKKVVKKKAPAVKSSGAKTSIPRKDFETFQFGVQRLKELEQEFKGLDAKGFSKEEQNIRSKIIQF